MTCMTGQLAGFQNAGVCLQAFPSCLALFFVTLKILISCGYPPPSLLVKHYLVLCDYLNFEPKRIQKLKPPPFRNNSRYIIYLLSRCVRKEWRAVFSSITQETNRKTFKFYNKIPLCLVWNKNVELERKAESSQEN